MEIGDPWITTINHIQAAEEPDWFFHMHAHENDLEISYILHGKGALYCDGRFYEVSEGDISLESIADRFHLSVHYLARQFRKYTSYTINKYIISCRMGEAQRRLIHTEDRIDDIAVICGFSNLSYFYASFKKNVGCTPMEFRKAYKNETEEQVRVNRA